MPYKLPLSVDRFFGYKSDPSSAPPNYLSFPCQNMLVTENGEAAQRYGYRAEFSIGIDGSAATAIYVKTYDVAFFALGTKVYYRDFTAGKTYDTGLTLTDGTTTRFWEWFGIVFCTNTTDGLRMIVLGRLNDAAANSGDANVTIDQDMAGRLSAFTLTAGNLRIKGTNEAMASLVVSTGVVTLTGTLSQPYQDNDFCIVTSDISSGKEKASKGLEWKSRFHLMGFPNASNTDQPNNTVVAGQFVIGQTGATGIEKIIDFTFGTGGSTLIMVGSGGKVANILGVNDYLYFFTEDKVSATAASAIDTSGSSIGLTIPDGKGELHGCLNEDCATVMGEDAITYITGDRRFMRIPIDTDTGAPIGHAQEDFDADIRSHLRNMDRDQTGALVYHYRGGRQTIYQVRILGQWVWFLWDANVLQPDGVSRGAWQPPQQITPVRSLFERNGVLYGTDPSDDTVYSFFTTFTDNLTPIYAIFAMGDLHVGNARLELASLRGTINQPSQVLIRCFVTNEKAGKRSGSVKTVLGSAYSYSEDNSVAAVPVGDGGVEAMTSPSASWTREFHVYPCEATRAQLYAENQQDGGYFTVAGFTLTGRQSPRTFSKSL